MKLLCRNCENKRENYLERKQMKRLIQNRDEITSDKYEGVARCRKV